MVEITVDAKPLEKLPYDPNDIPPAVRKRVAAVEAFYKQQQQPDQQPIEPSVEPPPVLQQQDSTPPAAGPSSQPPPPAVSSSTPPPTDQPQDSNSNSNSWKHQALAMKGRLEAANRDLGELQEQYYREVMQHRRQAPQQAAPQQPPPPPPQFLTQADADNYGNEMLDVSQRAALQVIAPHLQNAQTQIDGLRRENADLRAQQVNERRRLLDSQVEIAVPDYRDFDRNPRWHKWLMGIDQFSGRVRQQLLNEAISAGSAPRVALFFKGFRNEEAATGNSPLVSLPSQASAPPREAAVSLASLASPGRVRTASGGETAAPADKPIYTRALIKQIYEQRRRGAYLGRETEWARLEADIFAAQREGRFR